MPPATWPQSKDARSRRRYCRRSRGTGSLLESRSSARHPSAGSDSPRLENTNSVAVAAGCRQRSRPRGSGARRTRTASLKAGHRRSTRGWAASAASVTIDPIRRPPVSYSVIAIKARNPLEVHDNARRQQIFLHQIEQIDAARQDQRGIAAGRDPLRRPRSSIAADAASTIVRAFIQANRFTVLTILTGVLPSAVSTTAGVIGSWHAGARRSRCRLHWRWQARWRYWRARRCRRRRSRCCPGSSRGSRRRSVGVSRGPASLYCSRSGLTMRPVC